MFHRQTYRRRPVADLIEELRALPGGFILVDDNIIAERRYALDLFRAMVPLRKHWVSQCSVLIADDPDLLGWARAAGCRGLFIGIETASEANLAMMHKQFNQTSSYAQRLRQIRRAGIGVIAGMKRVARAEGCSGVGRLARPQEQAYEGIPAATAPLAPGGETARLRARSESRRNALGKH